MIRRVARPMLASIFIAGGLDALRHPAGKVPAAKPLIDRLSGPLERVGVPTDPELLVRANGAAQVLGGVMLATGFLPRVGSGLLAASLVPTTLAGHAFWEKKDPAERKTQQTQFLKNLGLLGGVLLAAADTAGQPGIAWRAHHLVDETGRSARQLRDTAAREARIKVLEAQHALS